MVWWQYLLLVNVYLLLFYGFYALLLRSETFFKLNRAYLVASAILSFVIPVIQTDWVRNLFITQKLNQTIYRIDMVTVTVAPQQTAASISLGQILAWVYLAGIAVLLIRLVFQLMKLRQALNDPGTGDAFSFFGKVSINKVWSEQEVIAAHEAIHARQWHSADVLLVEFAAIINWFNPVVYLYRKAIKHIHEFIADSEIITGGTPKQDYAMLLLSHTFNAPVNQLANSFFNHSLLKQRIMMLHKNPSQRKALLKYGLSAPLFALMVILSSATAKTNNVIAAVNKKAAQIMKFEPVMVTSPQTAGLQQSDKIPLQEHYVSNIAKANIKKLEATQTPPADTTKKGPLFTSVEQSAEFYGGMEAFHKFLAKNIHYPTLARNNNVQGKVICSFVVEEDGSITDLRVIRGLGSGLDEEAIRVLAIMPKWKPGKQNGLTIRQQYTVPIQFALQNSNPTGVHNSSKIVYGKGCENCGIMIADMSLKDGKMIIIPGNNNRRDTINNMGGAKIYVNDKPAPSDTIKKIDPNNIESIWIIGTTAQQPNAKKEIRIKTKN